MSIAEAITVPLNALYPDVGTSTDGLSWILLGAELIAASNITGLSFATLSDSASVNVAGIGSLSDFNIVIGNSTTLPSSGAAFQVIVNARQAYAYGIPLIAKPSVGESAAARQRVERFRHRMSPKAFEAFSRLAASETLGGVGLQRRYHPT